MNQFHAVFRNILIATGVISIPAIAGAAECPSGYPSKPISFVIGFAAGGGTDAIGRSLAAAIEQQQGWTIVVDNRPGAGGGVMSAAVKEVAPDGYTIGLAGTDTVTLNPHKTADSPYTYRDFDYLGSAMQINFGLAALADKPYSTLEEFLDFAKKKGRATVSVAGVSQEIAVRQIAAHFGANIVPVPGKGASDALKSALGDHVDATTQGTQHVQQIKAGKMKQLASLIDHRVDYAPDSKTLVESGLDVSIDAHTMFMVPKGVDPAIRSCLEQAFDEAVKSDSYGELMKKFNNKALNLGPDGILKVIERMDGEYEAALTKK